MRSRGVKILNALAEVRGEVWERQEPDLFFELRVWDLMEI